MWWLLHVAVEACIWIYLQLLLWWQIENVIDLEALSALSELSPLSHQCPTPKIFLWMIELSLPVLQWEDGIQYIHTMDFDKVGEI